MTTSTHADPTQVPGPTTGLAQVFAFYESDGHRDPAGAWQAFTGTWNWAAPLTTAVPRTGLPRTPAVRPTADGFTLSGLWHLPSPDGAGAWLALPLPGGEQCCEGATATPGGPDLFVVAARALPGAVHGATGDQGAPGPVFRLARVHVPTGLATHTAGMPLLAGDAAFLWTAVAALALGAARRMTDVLAGPPPEAASRAARSPVVPAVVAAELAAVLHDERLSLAAALHGAPAARQGLPPSAEERLATQVQQVSHVVQHVVTSAYEHALTVGWSAGEHPLVSLLMASSPLLQQARYATELLPPHGGTFRRKAGHGDDRRRSG
ncbi:hypothetical protein GCM10010129_79220 [Streptomyces fumigatiscleroticus]|nr:hypothetical protein GCM10010129_79220 [Streptomyces fumigatiscleroticus]